MIKNKDTLYKHYIKYKIVPSIKLNINKIKRVIKGLSLKNKNNELKQKKVLKFKRRRVCRKIRGLKKESKSLKRKINSKNKRISNINPRNKQMDKNKLRRFISRLKTKKRIARKLPNANQLIKLVVFLRRRKRKSGNIRNITLKLNKLIKRRPLRNYLNEPLINGVLSIKASLNNVILTYTDLLGNPIYWYSCGRIANVKKGSRSNFFIILETIVNFGLFLKSKRVKKISIKFNGFGLVRKTLLKGLRKTKLKVIAIHNITPLPHNGCRLKKFRRL